MSNFFERLREERERLGMNQTEMGVIGGVRKEAQSNYETGKRSPDAEYLARIAEAGADVGYILTGTRTPSVVREESPTYDPRKKAILVMVEALNGEGLDHVQDAAERAKQMQDLKGKVAQLERKPE
jgi:transcriptional regulator with XRE-family HTH domain